MLLAGLTLTACSPESFEGADPNGLPVISGTDFTMTVDQETNQMTATFPETQGVYPVWIINGTSYSTLNSVGYQNPEAGTYSIELKLGNRNGFSQGSIVKNFTFNETKVDYTPQFNRITGKEWRFANKEAAHLACGPAGAGCSASRKLTECLLKLTDYLLRLAEYLPRLAACFLALMAYFPKKLAAEAAFLGKNV